MSLNSLPSVKSAKSSLAKGHWGGGGGAPGTWSWDPGPPPWAMGSIYKKNVLEDPRSNTHTAAAIRKEVLTPPQPPPTHPKKGVHGHGGYGGQNPKNHWRIILGPKIMIYKGLDVRNHILGYAA